MIAQGTFSSVVKKLCNFDSNFETELKVEEQHSGGFLGIY